MCEQSVIYCKIMQSRQQKHQMNLARWQNPSECVVALLQYVYTFCPNEEILLHIERTCKHWRMCSVNGGWCRLRISDHCAFTPDTFALLGPRLRRVKSVDIGVGCEPALAKLVQLAPGVQHLNFHPQARLKALELLKDFTCLQKLRVKCDGPVDDAAFISNNAHLESMSLCPLVTEACLWDNDISLPHGLTDLALDFRSGRVEDDPDPDDLLRLLAPLQDLERLRFYLCFDDETSAEHIAHALQKVSHSFPALTQLELCGGQPTAETLVKCLKTLPTLSALHFQTNRSSKNRGPALISAVGYAKLLRVHVDVFMQWSWDVEHDAETIDLRPLNSIPDVSVRISDFELDETNPSRNAVLLPTATLTSASIEVDLMETTRRYVSSLAQCPRLRYMKLSVFDIYDGFTECFANAPGVAFPALEELAVSCNRPQSNRLGMFVFDDDSKKLSPTPIFWLDELDLNQLSFLSNPVSLPKLARITVDRYERVCTVPKLSMQCPARNAVTLCGNQRDSQQDHCVCRRRELGVCSCSFVVECAQCKHQQEFTSFLLCYVECSVCGEAVINPKHKRYHCPRHNTCAYKHGAAGHCLKCSEETQRN